MCSNELKTGSHGSRCAFLEALRKTLEVQEQVLEDLEQAKRANREESINKVQKALEETREATARQPGKA